MKFKPFCILVIGDTMGVMDEIRKISETEPSHIDGKGLYIATFVSALPIEVITDTFTVDRRNFMLFELNRQTAGFNLVKPEMHEGLFGFLAIFKKKELDDMTDRLLHDIKLTSETSTNKSEWKAPIARVRTPTKVKEKKLTENDISKMSLKEKEKILNEWIDKGLENLSENDRKMLDLLAK